MCGIVGYIGKRQAKPILMEGIKRLEYRGYDFAGIAVITKNKLSCIRSTGKIAVLEDKLDDRQLGGRVGIVHTRWATHGEPKVKNAHPHLDCNKKIAVVHNGIIENYTFLKAQLENSGHQFRSDTDTEVIAHLIEANYNGDFAEAVRKALQHVEGTYGLAIIFLDEPEKLVVARKGSPLVLGISDEEYIAASDVTAVIKHTRQIVYLEDNEMAVVEPDRFTTKTIENISVKKKIEKVSWNIDMIEKGGYEHFMLKEIHEQPDAVNNAIRGRIEADDAQVHLGGLSGFADKIQNIRRIIFTGCGTSWHAALIGEYMLEEFARIPVEVEYASEFRYRNPVLERDTLLIAITQSGETADTLAALREAKRKSIAALSICNAVGSSIAREADGGIYLHAGPEIGVASTKAFTSQLVILFLLTLMIGRSRDLSAEQARMMIRALKKIPDQIQAILSREKEIMKLARLYGYKDNFLYLGRGCNYPVALEGALKLKEISYIHAEGYPAAEMKHGPIALITHEMPVVFIALKDKSYDKILGNIEEVRARNGRVITIATEGDKAIAKKAHHVFFIPRTIEPLTPILSVIPLQLLAYHIAVMRGCNVDQPRNLAKSVTVE